MGFVERELERIAVALREPRSAEEYAQLYAAQQALSWATEPTGFASPFDMLVSGGTPAEPADCSARSRPPVS